jgi:hypothetical protein
VGPELEQGRRRDTVRVGEDHAPLAADPREVFGVAQLGEGVDDRV